MRTHALCALMLTVGTVVAQPPAAWAVRPASGLNPAAINQLGKLVYFVENGQVHVFSAFTRTWHSAPAPVGATLRHANDWLMIRGTSQVTAFSSMRGTFETLAVSPAAAVVNSTAQRNDSILLMRDGAQLHAFSGFVGRWVSRPVASGALVMVRRNCAVVADGTALLGMSAFGGTWVAQPMAAAVTALHVDGTVGVAETATQIWGFSAQSETWASTPTLGAAASFGAGADVAVWSDGSELLAFSGLRGRFARVQPGVPTPVAFDQQLAVATAGTRAWFFSAPRAAWTSFTTSTPAQVTTSAATAVLEEAGSVHAYSALLGQIASCAVSPGWVEVNWSCAAVLEAGTNDPQFYSAFTGTWSVPPPGPLSGFPRTAFNGGLIETQGGFAAFSARTGSYVALATPAGAVAHVDRSSAILAVEEPTRMHVFEARREVWVSAPRRATGPLSLFLWRTSMLALEAGWAHGFGAQTGEIESLALSGAVIDQSASSESVRVVTRDAVAAFSPVPDLSSLSQFPEFRRMFAIGSALDLQMRGPAGAATVVVLGDPARIPISLSIGTLLLDPNSQTSVAFSIGTVPADGRAAIRITVPEDPTLSRLAIAFQGALLGPGGATHLTRLCAVFVP